MLLTSFVVGVVAHRGIVGCPKPLPSSTHPKVVPSPNKEEEDEDTNPFSSVISDGEDSTEEEQERYPCTLLSSTREHCMFSAHVVWMHLWRKDNSS